MRLLLLGASGRTGRIVLDEAIKKGYKINCLTRKSDKVKKHKNITFFEGSPNDESLLALAIRDCNYIINVLNISRTSDIPWARLRTPSNFLSDVMNKIVRLAKHQKISRITICTAWGVNETKDQIPFWFRWIIEYSNISVAYTDHEKQEKILCRSKLNWTIVRPVGLTNSKDITCTAEFFDKTNKPNLTISRMNLAKYLINSLEKKELLGKKVVVSN